MADREINCHICGIYLGCIRDAKLHKKIRFTCYECSDDFVPERSLPKGGSAESSVVNEFKKIFGMFK
jgi:hypothetical protein